MNKDHWKKRDCAHYCSWLHMKIFQQNKNTHLFTTHSCLHVSQTSQNVILPNMSALPRGEDTEAKNQVLIIL